MLYPPLTLILPSFSEGYEKDDDSDASGPVSSRRSRARRNSPRKDTNSDIKASSAATNGGLKIRLSGLTGFGVRKSARERKPVNKEARYGELEESGGDGDSDSATNTRSKRPSKRKRYSVLAADSVIGPHTLHKLTKIAVSCYF